MDREIDKNVVQIDFECSVCKKNNVEALRIPIMRVVEKLNSYFEKNDLVNAERHLEYWLKEAVMIKDNHGELSVINELLGLYRKINAKEKGLLAVKRAQELLEITDAKGTLSGGTIMINMATTSKAFDDLQLAKNLYEKAYEIYKNHLEEDDDRFAPLYNNYATTLVDLKDYDKASDFYERAIALTNKKGQTLLDCAITYVNLAHLYSEEKGLDCEKIYDCLDKAEALIRDERVKRDGYYAFVCSKCAPSFDYFGYFALAEELNRIAKEIYERP